MLGQLLGVRLGWYPAQETRMASTSCSGVCLQIVGGDPPIQSGVWVVPLSHHPAGVQEDCYGRLIFGAT
ncbi:hypothetical protein DSO57_1035625 [Entomophthora muscae]|uniref:Uncharacterized protein n=1 Tax=Entomophthora muscae TaxID=34485 RepID=A0ACC2TXY2_9FUNG|nr:hypothetical protein DSO57_1035625 [Entomophthora muscae]